MERRRVRALSARTEFVPGYGQVHFDPCSENEDVRHPLMPVSVIERLVSNGWIADDLDDGIEDVAIPAQPSGTDAYAGEAELAGESPAPAAATFDHDGDGKPGGSVPADPPSLSGKNKSELIAIAAAEGVAIENGATNAEIVTAIEAGRVAAAIGEGAAPA